MDEVLEFCVRVIGRGPAAEQVAGQARAEGADRLGQLAIAAAACRDRDSRSRPEEAGAGESVDGSAGGEASELRVAVARELESATAALPQLQREALALRELLQLPYAEMAGVMGVAQEAVGSLLAQARLRLRDERRGPIDAGLASCPEPERALGLLASRQDGEPLAESDEEWLHAHLMDCPACETAHGAMLEASLCYRGWSSA